jgi:hypothetical protein
MTKGAACKNVPLVWGLAAWVAWLGASVSAQAEPFGPAVFDLTAAARPDELHVEEVAGSARIDRGVKVRELRYSSTAWSDQGNARPARIQAFVAVPAEGEGGQRRAELVAPHGLAGRADVEDAVALTRALRVVTLVLSAPGSVGSEGDGPIAQEPRPIFLALPELRASWLYQYAFAIVRAVTLLATLPEVDPRRLLVTGFRMGGLATFIVGGVDARVAGILPVAAAGDLGGHPHRYLAAALGAGRRGAHAVGSPGSGAVLRAGPAGFRRPPSWARLHAAGCAGRVLPHRWRGAHLWAVGAESRA